MEEYLRVGVITTTHGVKGEVKLFPTTDSPRRFDDLIGKTVFFDKRGVKSEVKIENVKYFKQYVIVKFEDINDMDAAATYRNTDVYVKREDAVPLEEDEYYIADLIGLKVCLEDGSEFGTLKDVMETGANDVYVVDTKEHGEVLLPVIDDCIKNIDLDNEIVTVHIMKGLI